MADDKYAPKGDDNVHEVHKRHVQLIKDQQWMNKKAREAANKPKENKVPFDGHGDKSAPPPSSPGPHNPDAPQNQPPGQHEQKNPGEAQSVNAPQTAPPQN